ncbi:hypothetical protein DENSPDRAFT_885655 [Dentipellis sp. KUC8613]|nr:hypothetical protein DENSPDRAFT_885655 [Dentipellis sp. KUC8613]
MSLSAIATLPPTDAQAAPTPVATAAPPATPLGMPPATPLGTPPATPPETPQAALAAEHDEEVPLPAQEVVIPPPPFPAPTTTDIPLAVPPGSTPPVTYNPVYLQMVETQDMCSFSIAYMTRARSIIQHQMDAMQDAMQEPIVHPNINPQMFEVLHRDLEAIDMACNALYAQMVACQARAASVAAVFEEDDSMPPW